MTVEVLLSVVEASSSLSLPPSKRLVTSIVAPLVMVVTGTVVSITGGVFVMTSLDVVLLPAASVAVAVIGLVV